MNRIQHFRLLAGVLAGAMLAFAASGPTAFASQLRADPPWWLTHGVLRVHPPLRHVARPVTVCQALAHTAVTGGMPGWQIALIAAGAGLAVATAAVLLNRASPGRLSGAGGRSGTFGPAGQYAARHSGHEKGT